MAKLEKGPIKKGQLILLIVLLTVSVQAILRALIPESNLDLLAFCLGVGAIIVVAARPQPAQPEKKSAPKRSYKDLK